MEGMKMLNDYILIRKSDFEKLYDHLCRAITQWEEDPNGAILYFDMVDLQRMFNETEYE